MTEETSTEKINLPEPLSDLLFDRKITDKQRKFILLLVHSEGLKTATQCATEAGYARSSAKQRAYELQIQKLILWLQKPLTKKGVHWSKGTSVVRKDL